MRPKDIDRPHSLKDVAWRIAPSRSPVVLSKVMRQVRHWTQNDLLRTMGGKETGRGIPRMYDFEPTCLIGAVLLELSHYGATIDLLRPIAEELYEDWSGDTGLTYTWTALTHVNAYVQAIWSRDPETGEFTDAKVHMFDNMDQCEPMENRFEEGHTSSILVNLNELAERVYLR